MKHSCHHEKIELINPYELIQKYRCRSCESIMMCSCNKDFGERFLQHQLKEGKELTTQVRVPVTLGFQDKICNECRGLPLISSPVSSRIGRTSKVKRYYWREIFFETTLRFDSWKQSQLEKGEIKEEALQSKKKEIENQVIDEILIQHNRNPKYDTQEESESDFLQSHQVGVIDVTADFAKNSTGGKAKVILDRKEYSVEDYAAKYFEDQGFKVIFSESIPFHVLFGIFMYLLIQDYSDEFRTFVMFGSRTSFDKGGTDGLVKTFLPSDFGTEEYGLRRKKEIINHINSIPNDREELDTLFSYWLSHSSALREYLWAHREHDVNNAKEIMSILSPQQLRTILLYLVNNYWGRYLGWPDLIIHKSNYLEFVEVKARSDKLSIEQKRWIVDNKTELKFNFSLLKIKKNPS